MAGSPDADPQRAFAAGRRLAQVTGEESSGDRASVTVCICTKDRTDELEHALRSVDRSSVTPSQVIVSDDGAAGTAARELGERFPRVEWLRGPKAGLGANRNHAASAVTSDHVLFLDDDAELDPGFLATALACLERQQETLRRRTIITGNEIRAGHLVAPAEQDFLGYQRRRYSAAGELKTIVVNSALLPREALREVAFDPRLTYGYDEVDFAARALQAGYRIVACPTAVNIHHVSPRGREGYDERVQAARLYVTLKRRVLVEDRVGAGLAFLVVAVPHALLGGLRRGGLSGLRASARAIADGLRMTLDYVRSTRALKGSGRRP